MSDLPPDIDQAPALYFPILFVAEFCKCLRDVLPNCQVVDRPVTEQDASRTIGVTAESWAQDEGTYVMGQFEPVENKYAIRIQSMTKAGSQAAGHAEFAQLAKMIRVILVRDTTLQLRLLQSEERLLSSVERVKGHGVSRQGYLEGRPAQQFLFLATTHVYVDTYTTFEN